MEFRVARQLGDRGESAWYVAATLSRLGQSEAALEAFAVADAEAPTARDALLDYYRAMACSDAHLLLCADALLASIGARAGPKIEAQVKQVRAALATALGGEPPQGAIDALRARAASALGQSRPALAAAYAEEAAALSRRRADGHGVALAPRDGGAPP